MTFNSVSWFLSSLLGVYFVAPFALKLFKKVKSKYGYVLLLAIVWLVRFLLEYFNGKLYYINSNHFPVFSILTSIGGMLLFPLSKDIKSNFIINSILEISLLAIVAWLAYVHVDDVCISIQILFVWAAFYIFILNNDVFSRFNGIGHMEYLFSNTNGILFITSNGTQTYFENSVRECTYYKNISFICYHIFYGSYIQYIFKKKIRAYNVYNIKELIIAGDVECFL